MTPQCTGICTDGITTQIYWSSLILTEAMQFMLSTVPADQCWGEKVLLSADKHGMTVHVPSEAGDDRIVERDDGASPGNLAA
ncbi:putative peptidase [Sodalis-like endosymbiont of Proechinophthirus fluctus]|uniref:putative peptidase n=1 Tax=Sodalis-like endosymbiont of Proechinophthirus fluctus TaxID=1462730 RepID=UPI000AC78E96|nr:putative peptidase [Sodalis-like endosymbiont of Proechinophthirus fluctus]